eukprot:14456232-Alexandrium_andersonii.AAC.1
MAQEQGPLPTHPKPSESGPEPLLRGDRDALAAGDVQDRLDAHLSGVRPAINAEPGRRGPPVELVGTVDEVRGRAAHP